MSSVKIFNLDLTLLNQILIYECLDYQNKNYKQYYKNLVINGIVQYFIDIRKGEDMPTDTIIQFNGAVLADMDASDTAYCVVYQNGGTQQADVDITSWFSGFLAC